MPNVKVVFSAETGQFVSNVDGMDKAVARSAENVAKAKNAILSWGQSSIAAAKEAGASSEQLASIQERTAQRLASVTEQNATRVVNALDRQAQKAREVAAEMSNLNKVVDISTAEGGLNSVPNRLKTSTVLRVAEGGTSIRGAEAFISAVPILSKLSDFVFPVASAIGFVAIIGEGISKLKEMYDAVQQVPSAIAEGFDAINRPLMTNVDALQKDNDQLQATIDKLEHKPGDGLALAIDDLRTRTDALTNSARTASEAITKLLTDQKYGDLSELLGKGNTTTISTEIKKRFDAITSAQNEDQKQFRYDDTMARAIVDPKAREAAERAAQAAQEKRQAAIDKQLALLQDYIRTTRSTINGTVDHDNPLFGKISYASVYGDQTANNNILNSAEDVADSMQLQRTDMATNARLTGQAKGLQGANQLAAGTNKAKAKQLKALEDYVNVWKTMAPVSQKALYDFWQGQLDTFKGAPEQLDEINSKLGELASAGADKAHEAIQKYIDGRKRQSELPIFSAKQLDVEGNTAESGRQLTATYGRIALANTQLQAEEAKTKVQIDLASGAISKQTADQRLAAITAQGHADKLADLRSQLSQFQGSAKSFNSVLGLYTDNREQQQYVTLMANIAKETGQAQVDAMKDAAQQAADTWQKSLSNAFDLWLQHATDTASQVKELFAHTVDGFNENLVNLMTGDYKRGDLKRFGHRAFKGVAGDILQQGEGHLLGALHIGKPDGSASNPLYVRMANGVTGAAHAVSSAVGSAAGGVSGFFGKALGFAATLFGGGRAVGGGVNAGTTYLVGERGPELFSPQSNGTIVPNHQLGGGNVYYTVHVANGVTPEQMDMRVRSALQEYHPHGVQAAVHAVHDHRLRVPMTSR